MKARNPISGLGLVPLYLVHVEHMQCGIWFYKETSRIRIFIFFCFFEVKIMYFNNVMLLRTGFIFWNLLEFEMIFVHGIAR